MSHRHSSSSSRRPLSFGRQSQSSSPDRQSRRLFSRYRRWDRDFSRRRQDRSPSPDLSRYPGLTDDHVVLVDDLEELRLLQAVPMQVRDDYANYRIEVLLNNVLSDGTTLMQGNVIHPDIAEILNRIDGYQTQSALGSQLKQIHRLRRRVANQQKSLQNLSLALSFANSSSNSSGSSSTASRVDLTG